MIQYALTGWAMKTNNFASKIRTTKSGEQRYKRLNPDGTPCDQNDIMRQDLLLITTALRVGLTHLAGLIKILANDDNEICGNYYKNARELGLTL